jgi:hypothetical protein
MMEKTLALTDGHGFEWEWHDYGRDMELMVLGAAGEIVLRILLNTAERRKLIAALSYCLP